MESIVTKVNEKLIEKNDFPSFSSGDTITVYYEIREEIKFVLNFSKVLLFK